MMTPKQTVAYLHLAVTWGFSFVILLNVVHAFGWAGGVAFRGVLAFAILALAARMAGRRLDFTGRWRDLAIVGATTVTAQQVFLSLAATRIGTAMSSIFVAAIPLFSMLIAQSMGTERITRSGLAGILIGLAGLVMLVGFPEVPMTGEFLFGCAAALLSAFFAAYGSNHASLRLRGVGAVEVTAGASLAGSLFALPLLALFPVPGPVTIEALLWLLALAGMVSALNYVIYFRLVAEIGATRTISVEFLVTVCAVIIGTVLLGESLSLVQFAGAGVIMAGCALVLGLFGRHA